VHLLDIQLEVDSTRPGGGHAKLQYANIVKNRFPSESIPTGGRGDPNETICLLAGTYTIQESVCIRMCSADRTCLYPLSIGCGGISQNLPRLEAGVCSERFPDLDILGVSWDFLEVGELVEERLTDLTNLMVGLAAILMVVFVILSVFGEGRDRDVRLSWVFASAGLALVLL
jgi:hypothetical protein